MNNNNKRLVSYGGGDVIYLFIYLITGAVVCSVGKGSFPHVGGN